MGVVGWMVSTADGFLAAAAETQFGAVAAHLGVIIQLMATLSVIGLFINAAFQIRSMDGSSLFWYALKLALIGLFASNWTAFNSLSSAVIGGLEYIAGALIASVGGGGASNAHFAAEFDELIEQFALYLNTIGSNLGWMTGAILGGIGLILLSILGFMTGIILIFAKMMISLLIGLAPIMIALSMFDATRDFFHRWVSTTISYAFYPIVIAAMFSTVIGMASALLAQMGDPASATNIGSLVPFFVMIFLAKGFVAATPLVVRGLSGNFMLVAGPAVVAGTAALGRGFVNTRNVAARARTGNLSSAETVGRLAGKAGSLTVTAANRAGEKAVRMAERARRLG